MLNVGFADLMTLCFRVLLGWRDGVLRVRILAFGSVSVPSNPPESVGAFNPFQSILQFPISNVRP